jgi:hypothetical protein
MPWTDRKQLAIPISHKEEANAVAQILDPDIGGDETFTGAATHSADGTPEATHIAVRTQLQQDTYDLLADGTTTEIADAIQASGDTGLSRSSLEATIDAMELEAGYKEVVERSLNGVA